MKSLFRIAIILGLTALLLSLAACNGGDDSGGTSGQEGALIGRWERTSGDEALPDALIFSGHGAGIALYSDAPTPFTWALAGGVLINTVGGQVSQAQLTWVDGNHLNIENLTPGSGPSSWARAD